MDWYAGPPIWESRHPALPPHWRPPGGLSMLDLRPLPEQQAGGAGLAVFFGDVAPDRLESRSDYAHLGSGDWADLKPSGAALAAVPRRKGHSPAGDTLHDVLLDLLTAGSDPDGLDGPRPLMPVVGRRLELVCGGRHREAFGRGHAHWNRVRDQLRRDFAGRWEADPDHARRCLDYECEKHGLRGADWRELVPANLLPHVPGRLPHATTVTDDFNRADGALGASWTDLNGAWGVNTNQAGTSSVGGGWGLARYDSDLSGADHYAQIVLKTTSSSYQGPACRVPSTATQTGYMTNSDGTIYVWKLVAGTASILGSASQAKVLNDVYKIEADGSTITAYVNGASKVSLTDTSITTGVRGGMSAAEVQVRSHDDFEAADLAAPPAAATTAWTRPLRQTRNRSLLTR